MRWGETTAPGIFAVGDTTRWPYSREGGLVRIEHCVMAQRQGQAVAQTILGERTPFTDVLFFWSQHYEIAINYVGHAECWEDIEIKGSFERHDWKVRYLTGRKLLAMASILRDRENLEAELPWSRRSRRDGDALQHHPTARWRGLCGAFRGHKPRAPGVRERGDVRGPRGHDPRVEHFEGASNPDDRLNLTRGLPAMANFRRFRTDASAAARAEATDVVA